MLGTVRTVPFGYLTSTVLVAWCTLFALAPPRPRRSSRRNVSYWFGFLLNELPFVAFYWLLVSTLIAVGQGDIDSPVGWLAFGVAVVTTVGLAVVVLRALRARPVLDGALSEGLGTAWRAAIDDAFAVHLRRRRPWGRILVAPYLMRRGDVERIANISYGDAGKPNQLDVYCRRARRSGGPTLVYLHGGAFRSGRKNREARPLIYRLASQGWVCVSANYRLIPAARFPDQLIDVKKVIAWVREHAHEFGADPSVLFVAGSSAGGNLAALAALTAGDARFQPGFELADTAVTGAISLYGYYGGVGGTERPLSSPHEQVSADAPPFFIAHGDRDTLVLVEDARAFVERLRSSSSNPVVYAELPGGQHTFDLVHSLRFEAVVDAIEAFAAWVRMRDTNRRSRD